MILFAKLAYSSPIRQKSPALKSLFSVGSLIVCVTFREPVVCLLIFLGMMAATLRFACLSPSRYFRLLLGPAVFLALSSVAILFVLSDTPPQLLAIPVFSRYLGISSASFVHWAQLMAVAFSSVSCLYFLILCHAADWTRGRVAFAASRRTNIRACGPPWFALLAFAPSSPAWVRCCRCCWCVRSSAPHCSMTLWRAACTTGRFVYWKKPILPAPRNGFSVFSGWDSVVRFLSY